MDELEALDVRAAVKWGYWGISDLADVLQSAGRAAGHSAPVTSVSVHAPSPAEPFPVVEVATHDAASLETLRSQLVDSGHDLLPCSPDASGGCFQAVTDDSLLHVWVHGAV